MIATLSPALYPIIEHFPINFDKAFFSAFLFYILKFPFSNNED